MYVDKLTEGAVMEAGKHAFDGECAPGKDGVLKSSVQKSFSVGIFQWLLKSGGRGCKRSPVKVRVNGRFDAPDRVYALALQIAIQLDAGAYRGPKHVTVPREDS